MAGEIEVYGSEFGLPPRADGETVEDYHKFLRYVLMPPGKRVVTEVARELGMAVPELMELALRNGWVERARRYDRERLEEMRLASASQLQAALREMLSAVTSVAQRVIEVAPGLEIGAHNVAQLMTAMGELVRAMHSIGSGQIEASGGTTLRDVITVITGATQAKMVRGESRVEIVVDDGSNEEHPGHDAIENDQ